MTDERVRTLTQVRVLRNPEVNAGVEAMPDVKGRTRPFGSQVVTVYRQTESSIGIAHVPAETVAAKHLEAPKFRETLFETDIEIVRPQLTRRFQLQHVCDIWVHRSHLIDLIQSRGFDGRILRAQSG